MIPNKKPNILLAIAVTISQIFNVLFFNGWPDEMLSARAYRETNKDVYLFGIINLGFKWIVIENILNKCFFWQDKHCYNTYIWEVSRTDLGGYYD